MAGKKGMKTRHAKLDSIRSNLWRAMRIYRMFTIPGLMMSTPGATEANVQKFLLSLGRHGFVTKVGKFRGGRVGEFQQYRLSKDRESFHGHVYPTVCEVCKQPISAKICDPSLKEKDKEKETKKEREEACHDDNRPDATAARKMF